MPLMKLNSPMPVPLPKEVQKCAKILQSFVDSSNNGLDGVIPRQVLENARGFAIFTVFKAGFVVSARAGSGVVIARLDDGTWSAPSAIGTAGMGFGGQAGAEVTDFLIVLNSRSAVTSFMSAGSVTLGGNMSVAVGPLGRNGEAVGSLNTKGKVAAMYSYSKTKGLFGGVSIEGSILLERQDANAIAYEADVTVKQLLSGLVPPPDWAQPLIDALENCTGMPGGRTWIHEDRDRSASPGQYHFGGIGTPPLESASKRRTLSSPFGRKASGASDSYFSSDELVDNDGAATPPGGSSRKKTLLGSIANRTSSYFGGPVEVDGYSAPDHTASRPVPHRFSTAESGLDPFKGLPIARSLGRSRSPKYPSDSPKFSTAFAPDEFGGSSFLPSSMGRTSPPQSSHPDDSRDERLSSPRWRSASAMFDPLGSSSSRPSFTRRASSNLPPPEPIDIFDEYPKDFVLSQPPSLAPVRRLSTKKGLKGPDAGFGKGIALYDFAGQQSGDLGFSKGDVIIILKRTDHTDDWWTGRINDRQGTFPANFIEVV